jgi:hypothetical protein
VSGDEDFLARWSRRKAAARRGEADDAAGCEPGGSPEPIGGAGSHPLDRGEIRAAGAPNPGAGSPGEADPERPAAEAGAEPAPSDLPDVASLDGSSDYRPFMRAGVPSELRRDALRRLWRTNPIINSLDGLDDPYVTQDFTDGATVVADLRTAYRVGKGMLDAIEKLAPEAAGGEVAQAAPPREPPAGKDAESASPTTTEGRAEPS